LEPREDLNAFLVEAFNLILRQEEKILTESVGKTISLKEIHVIGAVSNGMAKNQNTMSELAKALGVTIGTLTVSVNTLESKGYLRRTKDDPDKRMVRIVTTHEADKVNEYHSRFHEDMVDYLAKQLDSSQLESLVYSLGKLKQYFLDKSADS
jgi:DNA-binding MarR family transcriptional regulator